MSLPIANPSAHEKEHRHTRGCTQHAQAPAHGPPSGTVLDEAGKKGADNAAGRKCAVKEAVRLRSGALVAKDPRALLFLLIDGANDLGEHRGDDKGDREADEGEKRAEKHFLFQACMCDKSEQNEKWDESKEPTGSGNSRPVFVCEVA